MSQEQRSKICPFCEGRIPVEAMSCNYCGSGLDNVVHLHRDQNDLFSDDGFDSILKPPYLDKQAEQDELEQEDDSNQAAESKQESKGLFSLFLIGLSVQLTVVALMLLFFSQDGFLHLEFNAAYWPVYLFVSLPLLYWGIQSFDSGDGQFKSDT